MFALLSTGYAADTYPVQDIDVLTWKMWLALGLYAGAGWVMAHLPTAVRFIAGDAQTKASIITDVVASFAVGVGVGMYVLMEYTLNPTLKPEGRLSTIWAYFSAAVGAYGGKQILDVMLDGLKTAARNFFNRGQKE